MTKERGRASGGIGRGELLSLALCLCMDGTVLGGGIAAEAVSPMMWLLMWVVGPVAWGGLVVYTRMFAGMSLGAALEWTFGRALGRIMLFLLVVAWLVPCVAAADCAVRLWQALGQSGNDVALLLMFMAVCGVMAASGLEAVARVALAVVIPGLVLVLANLGLTLAGADGANLLPIAAVDTDWRRVAVESVRRGLVLFGGLMVLPGYFAQVRAPKRRAGTMLAACLIAWAVALIIVLCCRVVLSVLVVEYSLPVVQVFRLAEVGHWFSRFEVVGVSLLVGILLMRAAVALAAAVQGMLELRGLAEGWRWIMALLLAVVTAGLWCVRGWILQYGIFAAAAWGGSVPWLVAICGGMRLRREQRTVIVRDE